MSLIFVTNKNMNTPVIIDKGQYLCSIMYSGLFVRAYMSNGVVSLYIGHTDNKVKTFSHEELEIIRLRASDRKKE
jgi:hypothetical protein